MIAAASIVSLAGAHSDDARLLALDGDDAFRQAKFSVAEQAYRRAEQADRQNARAHLGLGRLEMIASHRNAARDEIAKAFQLDPHDPDIVLSYADFVSDVHSRIVLLRNYLALAGNGRVERVQIEEAAARLAITERLGQLESGRVASGYRAYRMNLTGYLPDGRNQTGWLISVRLNGGKPLRLIVDSGGDGIFVNSARAGAAHIERLTADRVSGAGSAAKTNNDGDYLGLAGRVSIGSLELEDALIHVTDATRFPNADGVIGLNVFEKFLIRVDPRLMVLDLAPLGDSAGTDMMPAYRVGHLLLVRALQNTNPGFFMLDTGASFNAVSAAGAIGGGDLEVLGAQGRVDGARRAQPMRIDVDGRVLMDDKPIRIDLREFSRHEGVEISGIIGYPLLGKSVLTVNYRDGLVQFGKPAR
jgi:tetratricopeptide (TPR) repeat protein